MHGGITVVNRSAGSGVRPSAHSFCGLRAKTAWMGCGFLQQRSIGTLREGIASRRTAPGPERCISRLALPHPHLEQHRCKKKHHDDIVVRHCYLSSYSSHFASCGIVLSAFVRSPLDQLLSADLQASAGRLRGQHE